MKQRENYILIKMCAAIQTVVTFPVWHGEGGDLDRETSLLLLRCKPSASDGLFSPDFVSGFHQNHLGKRRMFPFSVGARDFSWEDVNKYLLASDRAQGTE